MKYLLLLEFSIIAMSGCFQSSELILEEGAKPPHAVSLNSYQDSNGHFSLMIDSIDNRIIKWKFSDMAQYNIDTLQFSPPNQPYIIEWQNLRFISLRSSCGSPCWYSYMFPSEQGGRVRRFPYSVGFDTSRDLLLYVPNDLKDDMMLRLENIRTGMAIEIPRKVCKASMTFLCIDHITFTKDRIHISWNQAFMNSTGIYGNRDDYIIAIPDSLIFNQ